jgi:hypothetical protein
MLLPQNKMQDRIMAFDTALGCAARAKIVAGSEDSGIPFVQADYCLLFCVNSPAITTSHDIL